MRTRGLFILIAAFALALAVPACGGGDGSGPIEGPTLSVSEATSLILDQFFANGGLDDEYSGKGEFSVYLRDAATGKDVACTTQDGGMKKLSTSGVYYGGLEVPLVEVAGEHPQEMARFKLMFVEQDSDGCPEPMNDDDDIVGESAEFMFDALLGQQIYATNGKAAALFREATAEKASVKAMEPSLADGLAIDELYFDNGADGDEALTYYVFVDSIEDGTSVYQCQIDDALMEKIAYGRVVYAALNFPVTCFSADNKAFENTKVKFGLYAQKDSGPELVGETEPAKIGDLIGEKANFTNGVGYVSFRGVIESPFAAPVLRLEEAESLVATSLSYTLEPSLDPTIELILTDAAENYMIACAGGAQGLTGADSPGNYQGLAADFVAADGQIELFGWKSVKLSLVDRRDGLACPKPIAGEKIVLAESDELLPSDLIKGNMQFENGSGNVNLEASGSDN